MNRRGARGEENGFVLAVRARRTRLGSRMLMAGVVALVFTNLLSPSVVLVWLGLYAVANAVEWWIYRPALREGATLGPLRTAATALAMLVSAAVFGGLSLPLWIMGGPLGGVAAAFLLSAALLNTVVNTPGSRMAVVCLSAPHGALMLAVPWFVNYFGGGHAYSEATLAGAASLLLYAGLCWHTLDRSRRGEADARVASERKRLDAEAAVAAKSAFVATVSHELRTPISALTAGAAALEAAHEAGAGRGHAALIADAAQMMKTLLDDLLDHAKLDAGRLSVEAVSFDLRTLLAQSVRFWTAEARKKGLRLRVEGASAIPATVVGDPTRIRQILNNLLSNALKFTAEGEVTLRLSAWSADDVSAGVTVQVADTGRGMSRERLARLFEPFEQAEPSDARDYGGTGLGLYISRQLAELMGGHLTAVSAEGAGSTFTLALTLPLADSSAVGTARPGLEPHGAPLSVLVVDDHEINRRAVTLMLQPLGVRVTAVDSGAEALEAAAEQSFDVVLMDVRMPGMDGRETARRIRAGGGPNALTPILAVTADGEESDMQACRLAGMSGFVAKPIDPTRLIEAVDAAVTRPYAGTWARDAA